MAYLRSLPGMVLIVSLGVAAFFLIAEHRVHLSGFLPYALVALFIVFHLFMHGGHSGHGGHVGQSRNTENREPTEGGER